MKRFFCILFLLFGLFIFGHFGLVAQSKIATVIPSGMVVELDLLSTQPATQIALSRGSNGFWTSNIERIKGWKLPEGALPIQAVYFNARLLDEKSLITVSVFSGKRFREKDDLIATYTLSEGESAVISELSRFGVVPVRVKMVSVAPAIANVPVVINRSQAIKTEVAPLIATLPIFTARLANTSGKAIAAVVWNTRSGERQLVSAIEQAPYGMPLILPNQSFEITVPADNPEALLRNVTLTIEAVVFEDGSFEGDPQAAATYRSYVHGRRDALIKILSVVRPAVSAAPARPNVGEIIEKIDTYKREISDEVRGSFLSEFPDAAGFKPNMDGRFRAASDTVNNEVIGVLRNIKTAAVGRSDQEVNRTLSAYAQILQEWLDRLSRR